LLQRFLLFDLGDHHRRRVHRGKQVFQRQHILCRSDKGETDEVDLIASGPKCVVDIFRPHRRDAQRHTGEIDPLSRTNRAADHHATDDAIASSIDRLQRDGSIGQHDPVTDRHVID
jgi:hypothetical protein